LSKELLDFIAERGVEYLEKNPTVLSFTACPNDIPVMSLFRTVGLQAQKMMDYEPGRSYDEPAPATTFQDSELLHESGTK